MIVCECGGKLYRHKKTYLKHTDEEKQTFICNQCRTQKAFYRKSGGEWELGTKRTGGRFRYKDDEFMVAYQRARNAKPSLHGG